jgi:hypothetical protein
MNRTKKNNMGKVVVPENANKLGWGNLLGKTSRKMAEYIQTDFRKCKYDRKI